jgi:large subunit ribosomal protein L13
MDTGDHVIIINAEKVVLTSGKASSKMVYRHSGYPGGIKSDTYAELLDTKPADAVRRTIKGMLPKNRLGNQMLRKLEVYAGPMHPHEAQNPQPLNLDAAKARA